MCIVSKLIAGTQSEVVADGVTQAQSKLPRRVELVVIGLMSRILKNLLAVAVGLCPV